MIRGNADANGIVKITTTAAAAQNELKSNDASGFTHYIKTKL